MAKRQKEWGRRARLKLIKALGEVCKICGNKDQLEFDCIIPQGHEHHTVSSDTRICFYRKQHKENNIQLLCQVCHRKKTVKDMDLVPF